ncbi:MAG: hypothetical protein ABIQ81_04860 [Novosphingobium sp.]
MSTVAPRAAKWGLVRMLAIEEFEEIGFIVHAANDAASAPAMDAASAPAMMEQIEHIELLFTDIQMPAVSNGWGLWRPKGRLRTH